MDEDNVYPNDSSYFMSREPRDQVLGRKKEKAQTLEALPILQDLLKRLDEKITYYEANSSIPDDVRTDPQKFLIVHNSYTIAAEHLKDMKEYLQGLIDTNAPSA